MSLNLWRLRLIRSTILRALHLLFSTNIIPWRYSFESCFVYISLSFAWHANIFFSTDKGFSFNIHCIVIGHFILQYIESMHSVAFCNLQYIYSTSVMCHILKVLFFSLSLRHYLICWEIIFTDNKDKCDWYTEHAWACQASWGKVGKLSLENDNFSFYHQLVFILFLLVSLSSYFIGRILLTSTSEVYGDPLVHPQPESYWGNVNPIGICFSLCLNLFLGLLKWNYIFCYDCERYLCSINHRELLLFNFCIIRWLKALKYACACETFLLSHKY